MPRDVEFAPVTKPGWDPDFPVVGTVRYELYTEMTGLVPRPGDRCCIKRVEFVAICESRDEARQWMLEHREQWEAEESLVRRLAEARGVIESLMASHAPSADSLAVPTAIQDAKDWLAAIEEMPR